MKNFIYTNVYALITLLRNIIKIIYGVQYLISWLFKIRRHIATILQDINVFDSHQILTKVDIQKLKQYMFFSTLFAELLCVLDGRKPNEKEQKAALYLGAMAPFYDDFFDRNISSEKRVRILTHQYSDLLHANPHEKMYIKLAEHFYAHTGDVSQTFEKLLQAQKQGKNLTVNQSSKTAIKKAAYDKGGYTALLLRKTLAHPMRKGEEKAIYQLGTLIQFMDDIFDIYEDSRNQVCSLAYPSTDVRYLSADYRQHFQRTLRLFYQLPYKNRQVEKFAYLALLLMSRTFVCLDQLGNLPAVCGEFNPHHFKRASLICDMERPANLLKSLYYALMYSFKLP